MSGGDTVYEFLIRRTVPARVARFELGPVSGRRTGQMEVIMGSVVTLARRVSAMKPLSETEPSPLRRQAADALRRARKLPVGPDRNDLRQLALGLLWLDKKGLTAKVLDGATAILAMKDRRS